MLQRAQAVSACPSHTSFSGRPTNGFAGLQQRPLAVVSPQRAYSDSSSGSSRSVLDAFFYGKAFAEVVNERLGTLADEALVKFNKADAERRQAVREFLEQPSPDLQETVDELRADVAATRAQLTAYRARRQQKPKK
ncbi:hypothetical protein WJX73_005046 [Symbiochloris irregularis]|uniref:Uncharacterized protein n=1 Tax=Symbiochloris irregularis TaxID=706552 RepID=A0AAW1PS01_9CHLO